jgi:hypothetical protein
MTIPTFDIFFVDSDGNPHWLEAVATLAEAERRARELATATYPCCFILDQRTRQKHLVDLTASGNSV